MKLILIALSLILGLILAAEWLVMEPQQPTIEVRKPAANSGDISLTESDETKFDLPPIDDYRAIEERPLFVEGRRILVEEVATPVAPPPPPPPPATPVPVLDLRGILLIRNEWIALLGRPVEKDGESRLRVGSKIRDWTVTAIDADQVVMKNGAEQASVSLRKFSSVPLPAAGIPATGIPGAGINRGQAAAQRGKSQVNIPKPPLNRRK